MTRWLQDNPRELVRELRTSAASADLREMLPADKMRALAYAAADMIERDVVRVENTRPLHYSRSDRWRDDLRCIRGQAVVLRSVTPS